MRALDVQTPVNSHSLVPVACRLLSKTFSPLAPSQIEEPRKSGLFGTSLDICLKVRVTILELSRML